MTERIALFHGTSTKLLKSIQKRGLLPRAETGKNNYPKFLESSLDSVYLTDVYALHFAKIAVGAQGGNLLVARVIVDKTALLPDTDFEAGGKSHRRYDTAAACLEDTGCVRVVGTLQPNRLYVIGKKLADEFQSAGILTGLRHLAYRERYEAQLNWILQCATQYDYKGGEWMKYL